MILRLLIEGKSNSNSNVNIHTVKTTLSKNYQYQKEYNKNIYSILSYRNFEALKLLVLWHVKKMNLTFLKKIL